MLRTFVVALLCLLVPSIALADPTLDAALKAASTIEEHCSALSDDEQSRQADALVVLSQVWKEVGEVYTATQAEFLLYWRGVLANCIDRNDSAKADLEAFIDTQKGSTVYAGLVKEARTRLRRLGAEGAAVERRSDTWLSTVDRVELDVGWAGGLRVAFLGCTDPAVILDDGSQGLWNQTCEGQSSPQTGAGVAPALAVASVAARFWLRDRVGLGIRLGLDASTRHRGWEDGKEAAEVEAAAVDGIFSLEPRAPGPWLQFDVGPAFRRPNSSDALSGRTASIVPGFSVAYSSIQPWAGHHDLGAVMLLDSGTVHLLHMGLGLSGDVSSSVTDNAVFSLGGRIGAYVPAPPALVFEGRTAEPRLIRDLNRRLAEEESVPDTAPAPQSSWRMSADFQMGLQLVAPNANVSVGPSFRFGWRMAHVGHPNGPANIWEVSGLEANRIRRQRSTRRQDLLIGIGIDLHLGG